MNVSSLLTPIDERRARRILDRGGPITRTGIALRAGISLALDPADTEQVFVLAHAVDGQSLLRIRDELAASEEGARLLAERPAIDSRHVDLVRLRALPPDTLGGAYARMLDDNALSPDLFVPPPLPDPELAFVAQRIRQTHDIWHVVTGLGTDLPGEIALQAFTHAQLGMRLSWLLAGGGMLVFGIRYPRVFSLSARAHREGKRLPFLLAVRWEAFWDEPLAAVRARIGLAAPLAA